MKRSTARWTTTFAAAALLGLPATGWSQTPPSAPAPTSQQAPAAGQSGAAQEHIRKAQAALKDVEAGNLPAAAKSKVATIKRHLSSLEKSSPSTPESQTAAKGKNNWSTDVAAIDKILTELLGPATTSAATEPAGATGTTGKAKSAATLDDATKTKLNEVRTELTAFAAAMAGAPAPRENEPANEPAATTAPAAEASAATPPAQAPPQASPAPTQATPESATPQTSAQPPAEAAAPQAATPQSSSPDEAKRHLSAARDSLSQLTQLPAAAQLQGEPRNQVSQLIANFNELITTKENWRASYDKLNGNLMTLLGSETAAPAQPAPTGTPGAVGTSGATGLDPAIRGKLVEFKEHLVKFEKSAEGGAASPAPETSPAQKSADSPMGHLDAIEAILNAPPASGQAATSGLTLNTTQVEQLRTHLAEIRKALDKK